MIHNPQQQSRFNRNYVNVATAAFTSLLPFMQRELLLSRFTLMDAFDCCEFLCVRVCWRARACVYVVPCSSTFRQLPLCTVKKSYIMHLQRSRMRTRPAYSLKMKWQRRGVLINLLSENFNASWCRKNNDYFLLRLANKGKVIPVLK